MTSDAVVLGCPSAFPEPASAGIRLSVGVLLLVAALRREVADLLGLVLVGRVIVLVVLDGVPVRLHLLGLGREGADPLLALVVVVAHPADGHLAPRPQSL